MRQRAKGLEPSTSSLGNGRAVVLSAANKALTAPADSRCTVRCTPKPDRLNELAGVVALVARLPGADEELGRVLDRAVEQLLTAEGNESG